MKLTWRSFYSETELYKAALRLYTKPVFNWRKSLSVSTDQKTFYDFARDGLNNICKIHKRLLNRDFHFREGLALHYNFNGKERTVYIYPWEERLVDLLLYRLLNNKINRLYSPASFAYRLSGFGIDRCQKQVSKTLRTAVPPLYILKRDIVDYFNSVNHDILLSKLMEIVEQDDYLFELLKERVFFKYFDAGTTINAQSGIPFGTAIACFFANLYLTELDHKLYSLPGLYYFRYADDFLILSENRQTILRAEQIFKTTLESLQLKSKRSHERNILFSNVSKIDEYFKLENKFKHLGLEFRADGSIGLSKDKFRKICNLFYYKFRRYKKRLQRFHTLKSKINFLIELSKKTLTKSIRNVAIIDYYLKHVNDEKQLRLIDRWLAEEVLAQGIGNGYKKGNFKIMSYKELRENGLPPLLHRRRLIQHGHIVSSFFVWKEQKVLKSSGGTVARLPQAAFSPGPEAVAVTTLVRERATC